MKYWVVESAARLKGGDRGSALAPRFDLLGLAGLSLESRGYELGAVPLFPLPTSAPRLINAGDALMPTHYSGGTKRQVMLKLSASI